MAPPAGCLNFAAGLMGPPTFTVTIKKNAFEHCGFSIRYSDRLLLVTRVLEDTPMAAWNQEHPTRQVQFGSRIRSVNGKRNIFDMIIALQESSEVLMEVGLRLENGLLSEMMATDSKKPQPLMSEVFDSLPERHCSCCTTTSCAVCLDDFEDEHVVQLPCGHGFHRECIAFWLLKRSPRCPLCMQVVDDRVCDESCSHEEEEMQPRDVSISSPAVSRTPSWAERRLGSRGRSRVCVSRISL
ncbi:unnamed protein product [Durusdinium trenchii]